MAHDVFISYAAKDVQTANAVCRALEANDVRVWIAPRDMVPGVSWAESIPLAIRSARVMVVIFSEKRGRLQHMAREIDLACDRRLTIIPFRIENVEPGSWFKYYVRTVTWFDAFTPPLEQHLQRLAAVVRQVLDTKINGEGGAPTPQEAESASTIAPKKLLPVGFWSYARQDDDHSDGQLSQLHTIVRKAINLRHGDEQTLWQDISAIPYGADWAATIDRTIGQVTFFIPVITPRYLKSKNCFAEFEAFGARMKALGRDDLIFPIYYVDVENLQPSDTAFGDGLAALRRHQMIDFRPLRYEDPSSSKVRQWADRLAASILDAMRR